LERCKIALERDRLDLDLADQAMGRYADGDVAAFAVLYDSLAPALFRFAMSLGRHRALAEDVVQQTFLQLHRSRHRWVRGARVRPWAYAIAHHFHVDSTRRGWREQAGAAAPEEVAQARSGGPDVEDELDNRRSVAALRLAIEKLPEAQRLAFQLVVLEGLSVAEAAEVLGISASNVKIRTFRARVALKRLLKPAADRGVDGAKTTSG
jgi:RNA polymerase sigma-70 factor (ECF subfamily)